MYVFVLDKHKKPLDPTHPAKARKMLKAGRAKLFKRYPFTIILQDLQVEPCQIHDAQLKIDPGSQTTGLAILQDNRVLWGAELTHRGEQIKQALYARRQLRRGRRSRQTRYRPPRFLNRKRPEGWLPPSLQSRVDNIVTWVNRLTKVCPIGRISQELVRFDTQKIQNPEISGTEYQQGTLYQYELREYLLDKWGRQCAYCGAKDVPLQVEHIVPQAKGGSHRASNLTLACHHCNRAKGNRNLEEFLSDKPEFLQHIQSQAKKPLADAAAVNATRWKLYESLQATELDLETGSGGVTKFNRTRNRFPKTHWLDAACVGQSTPKNLKVKASSILVITARGHGCRQMMQMDKYGFPRAGYQPKNPPTDWKTGDIVRVVKGKHQGIRAAKIKTVRAKGNFDLKVGRKVVSVSRRHIQPVFRHDGYGYEIQRSPILSSK
jgi:5-methylcytosine-specific restriction endonuclease McrA